MRAFVHGTFLRQRTTATTTAATITTHNLGKQAAATTRRNLFFPAMPIGFRRITNDRANSRKARHEALKKKNLLSGPHHKARYSLGRKLFLAYSPRLSYSPWFLSRVFTWFFSFSSRFRPPRTFEFAPFSFFRVRVLEAFARGRRLARKKMLSGTCSESALVSASVCAHTRTQYRLSRAYLRHPVEAYPTR